MDVTFIYPFLEAAVNVLQTMAFTETQGGKPFLKGKTRLSEGLVIPFAVGEDGKCFLEVCLTESDSRHVLTPKTPRLLNSLVDQEPER